MGDYAIDVLSTPLMFADLTHTPEAVASGATPKELHRPAFRENAGEVYPDRELNHTRSTTSSPRTSTTCA